MENVKKINPMELNVQTVIEKHFVDRILSKYIYNIKRLVKINNFELLTKQSRERLRKEGVGDENH